MKIFKWDQFLLEYNSSVIESSILDDNLQEVSKEPDAGCTYYNQREVSGENRVAYKNLQAEIKAMNTEEKREYEMELKEKFKLDLQEVKQYYINWFNNSQKVDWFSRRGAEDIRTQLVNKHIPNMQLEAFLNRDSCVAWCQRNGSQKYTNTTCGGAWGFVSSNNFSVIYLNFYNFYDGTENGDADVKHTLTHEVAHSIDLFLKNKGFKTSPQVHGSESTCYIKNDMEDYARLNTLRETIGAGPNDSGEEFVQKFIQNIKNGNITSPSCRFFGNGFWLGMVLKSGETVTRKDVFIEEARHGLKSGASEKNSMYDVFLLLSNYGTMGKMDEKQCLWVNFDEIAKLNRASARGNRGDFTGDTRSV
jgi:hypothetical protein